MKFPSQSSSKLRNSSCLTDLTQTCLSLRFCLSHWVCNVNYNCVRLLWSRVKHKFWIHRFEVTLEKFIVFRAFSRTCCQVFIRSGLNLWVWRFGDVAWELESRRVKRWKPKFIWFNIKLWPRAHPVLKSVFIPLSPLIQLSLFIFFPFQYALLTHCVKTSVLWSIKWIKKIWKLVTVCERFHITL